MGFLGAHYGSRFGKRDVNIDKMLDTLIDVQKVNGVDCTLREALFHPSTSERVNVFRRKRLELTGGIKEFQPLSKTKPGNASISNIERGVFVYDSNDLEEDTDEPYVCEFCTQIDSDGIYRSDICDLCEECEKCTDYRNNECDGCEYSITFNGGSTYGEVYSDGEVKELSAEDKVLLDEFSKLDGELKTPSNAKEKFSIMNF